MKSKGKKHEEKELNIEHIPTQNAIRQKRSRVRNMQEIKSFLFHLVVLVGFIVIVFWGMFGIYATQNDDMAPRISPGDLLLYFRYSKDYLSEDVVIYKAEGELKVGRIIATEGDKIEIKNEGGVYINDCYEVESNIYFETCAYEDYVEYPVELKEDEFFILADNREESLDSRYYGPISKDDIIGKVISLMRRGKL